MTTAESVQPSPAHAPQAQPAQAQPAQAQPAQAQPEQSEPPEPDNRLSEAINDSYSLLDFACRCGSPPSESICATIIAAQNTLATGKALSASDEVAFWSAFATITEAVKPVTVQSILFTSPTPKLGHASIKKAQRPMMLRIIRPGSHAERSLRSYLAMALMTLLMLLSVQVQWAIGTFIYNDALKVHRYLLQAQDQIISAQALSENVKGTPAEQQVRTELQVAQNRLEQDKSWSDVSYVRLWWWNRGAASYFPPYDLIINRDIKRGSISAIEGESGVTLDVDGKSRLEFTRTELTLQVLSNYILVMLFALMGALTQTIRMISMKIQDVSLTANELYRLRARIILGVISGACLAWLYIITSSADTITTNRTPLTAISFLGAFTPWAIAFMSGYSVEIFFTLLERIIAVINSKIQTIGATPTQPNETKSSDTAPTPAPAPAPKPQSS